MLAVFDLSELVTDLNLLVPELSDLLFNLNKLVTDLRRH